jgi:hypothetical protein
MSLIKRYLKNLTNRRFCSLILHRFQTKLYTQIKILIDSLVSINKIKTQFFSEKYIFFLVTTSSSTDKFSNIGSINNITFHYPAFPLLLEPDVVREYMFCDEHSINYDNCLTYEDSTMCPCIHRIKFDLNSIAELILVNMKDKISHPVRNFSFNLCNFIK